MIRILVLPEALQDAISDAARDAFPRECCGLVEGRHEDDVARAMALHPMRNVSEECDRFEIDPADHIRILKTLRGTGRDIVGCYHSHPNGLSVPSTRDIESAFGEDFVWIIAAAVSKASDVTVRSFVLASERYRELEQASEACPPRVSS